MAQKKMCMVITIKIRLFILHLHYRRVMPLAALATLPIALESIKLPVAVKFSNAQMAAVGAFNGVGFHGFNASSRSSA